MALPKAAQKQLADAEKLHAEVYPNDAEATDKQQDTADVELREVPKGEAAEAESTPSTGETRDEATRNEESVDSDVDWEHKYNVLQGKYNAEVPRLQQDNNALQGRMNELEQQLRNMQMAPPYEEAEPTRTESLLKPDEIEDYGEDMIDVVKRAAREEFAPALSKLKQENEGLRALLGGMQQQTAISARDAMLGTLDSELKNWRQVNSHPDFIGWLENVDPYSGHKKLDMLRQAYEGNNTARVLAFFKGFLNENAAFTPTPTPNAPADPQVSLETLVAPGRPSEGDNTRAQDGNANGNAWTQDQIQAFYRDVNRGVYRNKPDEKDRIEADIFLAQSRNLIT
jgi:hypothetical protein